MSISLHIVFLLLKAIVETELTSLISLHRLVLYFLVLCRGLGFGH